MISFSLESANGNIDLGALGSNAEGAEAQAGITGLGLPPLDVQWVSGAGDGATYRGQRVLPRDIDIPIEFVAASRANLQTQMDALSKALAVECTLRATDGATSWYVKVRRVSGGDYATGVDSNGYYNMRLTLTLRAGDPFWISSVNTSVQQTDPSIGPTLTLTNDGSADAYAKWTIDGPGLNPKLTSPTGEVLEYAEFIAKGSKIVIDTKAGTVVDELGNNRYAGLSPAPRFFKIKPGSNVIGVSYDRSSAAFLAKANEGIYNLITNPQFFNDSAGWTLTRFTRDGTAKFVKSTKQYVEVSPVDTNANPGSAWADTYCSAAYTVTGLTVGTPYSLGFAHNEISGTPAAPAATHGLTVNPGTKQKACAVLIQDNVRTQHDTTSTSGTVTFTFTATATTATLYLLPARVAYIEGQVQYPPSYWRGWYFYETSFDNVHITPPGVAYFDGATTDTATYDYSWTGTAHASTSKRVDLTAAADTTTAKVKGEFNARKWMVV